MEHILRESGVALTVLRASIIVGSGSASFEIIRDLAEKLPVLVTPRWVHTHCQPIAIRNVLDYLTASAGSPGNRAGHAYDIGGPEVMSYLDLIKGYCEVRGLRRGFCPTRLLSPRLSSGWLCLLTVHLLSAGASLVDSLTHETVCHDGIRGIIPLDLLTYREAVERALARIAQNHVPSSWIDSLAAGTLAAVFVRCDQGSRARGAPGFPGGAAHRAARRGLARIWAIGGATGWPSMNWAWDLRGFADKLVGGIGIRRGRRHPEELHAGDALDFWRVLLADRAKGRLMLYAEMKLPGEAWLEFAIEDLAGRRSRAAADGHLPAARLVRQVVLAGGAAVSRAVVSADGPQSGGGFLRGALMTAAWKPRGCPEGSGIRAGPGR